MQIKLCESHNVKCIILFLNSNDKLEVIDVRWFASTLGKNLTEKERITIKLCNFVIWI